MSCTIIILHSLVLWTISWSIVSYLILYNNTVLPCKAHKWYCMTYVLQYLCRSLVSDHPCVNQVQNVCLRSLTIRNRWDGDRDGGLLRWSTEEVSLFVGVLWRQRYVSFMLRCMCTDNISEFVGILLWQRYVSIILHCMWA